MYQNFPFNTPVNSVGFFPAFPLIIALPVIVGLALWLWAIIDCVKRTFLNQYEKAGWIVALIIFPLPALIAYAIAIKMTNGKGVLGQ